MSDRETEFDGLLTAVRACRICVDQPAGAPLPHAPRPVFQIDPAARVLIAGQAPGTRVHLAGRPFADPSGDRLRRWLGIGPEVFYDSSRLAILPMGFCVPGLSAAGADLPPRRECAPAWRARMLAGLPRLQVVVTLGVPAAAWHLGLEGRAGLAEVLANWRLHAGRSPAVFTLPHPSWRNNALLRRHPWIEREIVPALQKALAPLLA
jgi:uracil-DNA glycosylase